MEDSCRINLYEAKSRLKSLKSLPLGASNRNVTGVFSISAKKTLEFSGELCYNILNDKEKHINE